MPAGPVRRHVRTAHLGAGLPALTPRPLPSFSAFTARTKFETGASKLGRQSSMKTCAKADGVATREAREMFQSAHPTNREEAWWLVPSACFPSDPESKDSDGRKQSTPIGVCHTTIPRREECHAIPL